MGTREREVQLPLGVPVGESADGPDEDENDVFSALNDVHLSDDMISRSWLHEPILFP